MSEDEPKRGPLGGLRASLPQTDPLGLPLRHDPLGGSSPPPAGREGGEDGVAIPGGLREGGEIRVRASCALGVCDGSGWLIGDDEEARPCECRRRRIERSRTRGLRGTLPRRFEGVSLERPPIANMARHPDSRAAVATVAEFCEGIDGHLDEGHGLWLMGDPGTGKTTLAMLISKSAMEAGRSVAIYSVPALLARIRQTFDSDAAGEGYLAFFERLVSVDLLHLDDLGAEKPTEWVLEQLYAIIDRRYNDRRSILVTTNLEDDRLKEQLGPRTVSRLYEMSDGYQLPLYGRDRRVEAELSPAAGTQPS